MQTPNEIADGYIEVWNERDRARRDKLIASGWSEGATYVDPLMQARGAPKSPG